MQNATPHIFTVLVIGTFTAGAAIQPIPVPVTPPPTPPVVAAVAVKTPPVFVITPKVAKLIAPDELSAIYEMGIGVSDLQASSVTRRLGDLRAARFHLETPLAGKGPGHKDVIQADGKTTTDFKGKQIVERQSRWGGFLTGSASRIDLEDGPVADGYGIDTGAVTLGIDYQVTDKLTLGVLLGYANSHADLHGGRISANTGTLGLYGSWVDGGFYVNGLVSGSYSDYDIKRGAFGGKAHGDTEGGAFSGLLSTGYDFQSGAWTYGPFVDVQYTAVQFNGYREHGSDFPLEIQDNRSDSLRSRLGARISRSFLAGRICPELALSWQHEYLDESRSIGSSFATGSHSSFRVDGPQSGRDSLVVNAAVTFLLNDRWSTYVAYDAVLARDNYGAQAISGGVQVRF